MAFRDGYFWHQEEQALPQWWRVISYKKRKTKGRWVSNFRSFLLVWDALFSFQYFYFVLFVLHHLRTIKCSTKLSTETLRLGNFILLLQIVWACCRHVCNFHELNNAHESVYRLRIEYYFQIFIIHANNLHLICRLAVLAERAPTTVVEFLRTPFMRHGMSVKQLYTLYTGDVMETPWLRNIGSSKCFLGHTGTFILPCHEDKG